MTPNLSDFKTEKGRIMWLMYVGLMATLEYPNCEGKEDMARHIERWEKELAKYWKSEC